MMVLAAIISQRSIPPQFAFNQAAGKGFLQNPDHEGADVEFEAQRSMFTPQPSRFPFPLSACQHFSVFRGEFR